MSQASKFDSEGFSGSGSLIRLLSQSQLGAQLSQSSTRSKPTSTFPHVVGCWRTSNPHWMLTGTSFPYHVVLSIGLLPAWWLNSPSSSERKSQREIARWNSQSFCNLVLDMIYLSFCYILFVRNDSLRSANTQGRVLHEIINSGRGVFENYFCNSLPQLPSVVIKVNVILQDLEEAELPRASQE